MILVFSEEKDNNVTYVIRWLRHYGYSSIRITEKSVLKLKKISIGNTIEESTILLNVNGNNITVDNKTIVFARRYRLKLINAIAKIDDPVFNKFVTYESETLHQYVCHFLENKTKYCLGSLVKLDLNKLIQLSSAVSVGLKIPKTEVVTEKYSYIMENSKCITKPISEIFSVEYNKKHYQSGGAFEINSSTLSTNWCFPSLIQQKIGKDIELRAFFIEEKYFFLARRPNYGSVCKKADWRDYNSNFKKMHFYPIQVSNELLRKLIKLSKILEINTGSYDILFLDGEYYFLEVNIHGQFGFVSVYGNHNIEQQIAKHLISKLN